jgi:hypothetical protein
VWNLWTNFPAQRHLSQQVSLFLALFIFTRCSITVAIVPVTRFILSHFFFLTFTFALRLPFVATTRLIAPHDLSLTPFYPEPPVA